MSFILLIIGLVALFIYWYKNDGVFYFKTTHVEISVTPQWIRDHLKAKKQELTEEKNYCKGCGVQIPNNKNFCEHCIDRYEDNYTPNVLNNKEGKLVDKRKYKNPLREEMYRRRGK